jgi:hypothetical protein
MKANLRITFELTAEHPPICNMANGKSLAIKTTSTTPYITFSEIMTL